MPDIKGQLSNSPTLHDRNIVLVAEDNAEMRRFITAVLSDEYRVVPCADGAEALNKATADPPDLVVTDLMMPNLDRLVAAMRTCEPLTQVPVLMLSEKADEALPVKLLVEPVQDYIIKPFQAEELRARVRNLVMIKRSRDLLQKELASRSGDLADLAQHLVTGYQALRASEERWRAIFENSAVGIAITNPEGAYTATNRAYQEMVGYSDAELRALSYIDITHDEDREATRVLTENLLEGKLQRFRIEKRYRRKDGKLIWVRSTVSLASGTETAPSFGISIIEDITERKQAEENLRRSETYLAESERLGYIGTWAINVHTREIAFWSKEHYRIFGFDPGLGVPSLEAALARFHPEDSAVLGILAQALNEMKDFDLNYRIVRPDGSVRYIRSLGHPVRSDAGELMEFNGMAIDVTERKLAEDALRRSFDQLRALTAQLQSVREEERTRVAREIHDELGQALTAIKLDVASLVRELPENRGPAVQRSQSILKLLDETIQSVQRISTDLRPRILDDLGLAAALEWAAGEFEARTGTKCRISMPDEEITSDPDGATALFRIFQETLTNVARHANATEVSVRLTKENDNLVLEVQDNGLGLREEHLSAAKSLGILGMRERALKLGGDFMIQSVPGGGTTVKVRIPRVEPQTRATAK